MSEENKQQQVEYTPTQLRAMEMGWKPKEQYEGEEDNFVDAPEFIRRGELFGKINEYKKEVFEMKNALKAFQSHHEKVKETEYKRAVAELRAAKKEALLEGDADKVIAIEDEIDELKDKQAQEAQTQKQPNGPSPEFMEFKAKNKWYQADSDLTDYADFVGTRYAQQNPNLPIEEVFKYVEKKVRDTYPEKFENPNRQKAPSVEGSANSGKAKATFTESDLTNEEKMVMQTLIRSKVMTKDQYIAEVKALREAE